jgi:hypothetical protein
MKKFSIWKNIYRKNKLHLISTAYLRSFTNFLESSNLKKENGVFGSLYFADFFLEKRKTYPRGAPLVVVRHGYVGAHGELQLLLISLLENLLPYLPIYSVLEAPLSLFLPLFSQAVVDLFLLRVPPILCNISPFSLAHHRELPVAHRVVHHGYVHYPWRIKWYATCNY